jgi:hypothetical protein
MVMMMMVMMMMVVMVVIMIKMAVNYDHIHLPFKLVRVPLMFSPNFGQESFRP